MSESDTTVQTAENGRQPDGKFGQGNQFAAGHKRRKRVHELRSALTEAITPEMISSLVIALSGAALSGDVAAAKLLLHYGCGRPDLAFDPMGDDAALAADEKMAARVEFYRRKFITSGNTPELATMKAEAMVRLEQHGVA